MEMDCSLPVPLILGGYVHDAVGVDIEGYLDLRHAAGRGGDAGELEAAQSLVVRGELTLALEHMHVHGGLAVRGGGEHLRLLDGDGGVALDQFGEHAAQGLNAQRQRSHVQQHNVLHVAAQHAALDGSADGHALVGVDALIGLLAGDPLHGFLHGGDTGGTAHQDNLVDVLGGKARVLQSLGQGRDGADPPGLR